MVRTALMQCLQFYHEFKRPASEPFRSDTGPGSQLRSSTKFCGNLVLPERVVLELLGCLLKIDRRGKDVVQAELSRENVHHDSQRVGEISPCNILVFNII